MNLHFDDLPEEMIDKVEERFRALESTWDVSRMSIKDALEAGVSIGIACSVQAIHEQISPSDMIDEKEVDQFNTMIKCCEILVGELIAAEVIK